MITDTQTLIGAESRFVHSIPVYDDMFGKLYISRDSLGVNGIIRAQSWEIAYEICEDEFFPEADETVEDMEKEFGENWSENPCWNEQYGFRPNGSNVRDIIGHGIYAKDLNGDYLDRLTPSLLAELEITLEIVDNEE